MIKYLALKMSQHYSKKSIIQCNKQEIYAYGFELLISTIFNFAGIFLISCLWGEFPVAFFFIIAFIPLRLAAGGYHAKHHWSCILGFNAIFLLFIIFIRWLNPHYFLLYSLIATMVSCILVWNLAPVEAINKPLNNTQYTKQRKRSIILSCVNLAITFIFFLLPQSLDRWLAYYSSGTLSVGILLIVAKINAISSSKQCVR